MYFDDVVIAGFLAVAGTIAFGSYVLYFAFHEYKLKSGQKQKAHH